MKKFLIVLLAAMTILMTFNIDSNKASAAGVGDFMVGISKTTLSGTNANMTMNVKHLYGGKGWYKVESQYKVGGTWTRWCNGACFYKQDVYSFTSHALYIPAFKKGYYHRFKVTDTYSGKVRYSAQFWVQ